MISLRGFSAVSEDPAYQNVRKDLEGLSDDELARILNKPVLDKKSPSLALALTTSLPFLDFVSTFSDVIRLNGMANSLVGYATEATIQGLGLFFGYKLFFESRIKRREQYEVVAADTILSERNRCYLA